MASGEAAEGDDPAQSQAPSLVGLPLLPLARITQHLTKSDLSALARTCRALRDVAPQLMSHTNPGVLHLLPLDEVPESEVVYSPDGAQLAVPMARVGTRLWRVPGYVVLRTVPRITNTSRTRVAYAPHNGNIMYTAATGSDIHVWDTHSGELTGSIPINWRIGPLNVGPVVSHNGERIALAFGTGDVCVYDSGTRAIVGNVELRGARIAGLAFHPDGVRLFICTHTDDPDEHGIYAWNMSADRVDPFARGVRLTSMTMNSAGTVLATTTPSAVVLWDVSRGEQIGTLAWHVPPDSGHSLARSVWYLTRTMTASPTRAQFSPDGKYIMVCYSIYPARLWNVRTRRPVWTYPADDTHAMSVAFHPDRKHVALALTNRTIAVVDLGRFART